MLLLADSSWYRAGYHLHIIELLMVPVCIWVIYLSGSIYYNSGKRMYAHPTAIGSAFVKSALMGISLNVLIPVNSIGSEFTPGTLIVLITLDLFILIAMFRFLAQSGDDTNRVAQKLLGEYIFLFGARIIIGIFIPLILLIYSIYISIDDFKGAAALMVLGVVLHSLVLSLAGTENVRESISAS